MVNFIDLLVKAEGFGLRDALLPFLMVFTIVFAILEKAKILGEKSKRFNVVISIVLGLLFVIPHVTGTYPYGYDPVNIINDSIPDVTLAIIGIFAFFLLVAMFSGKNPESLLSPDVTKLILLLSAVTVFLIFGGNAGWWNMGFLQEITKEQIGNVSLVLFFLFMVYYVIRGEEIKLHEHITDHIKKKMK